MYHTPLLSFVSLQPSAQCCLMQSRNVITRASPSCILSPNSKQQLHVKHERRGQGMFADNLIIMLDHTSPQRLSCSVFVPLFLYSVFANSALLCGILEHAEQVRGRISMVYGWKLGMKSCWRNCSQGHSEHGIGTFCGQDSVRKT